MRDSEWYLIYYSLQTTHSFAMTKESEFKAIDQSESEEYFINYNLELLKGIKELETTNDTVSKV